MIFSFVAKQADYFQQEFKESQHEHVASLGSDLERLHILYSIVVELDVAQLGLLQVFVHHHLIRTSLLALY